MAHNYVANSNRSAYKPHKMTHEEMNHWFFVWGIIVKRRHSKPVLRPELYFDKGPGPASDKRAGSE